MAVDVTTSILIIREPILSEPLNALGLVDYSQQITDLKTDWAQFKLQNNVSTEISEEREQNLLNFYALMYIFRLLYRSEEDIYYQKYLIYKKQFDVVFQRVMADDPEGATTTTDPLNIDLTQGN